MAATPPNPPPIGPAPAGPGPRPRWSVVLPARNRVAYLPRALESVVSQALDPAAMEIIVVDNSDTPLDLASLLPPATFARIRVHRHAAVLPMMENWNACVGLACGELIHLLHDDDWIEPGFYAEIGRLADAHPDLHFYAVRSLHVTPEGLPVRVVDRLPDWEKPSRDPSLFFGDNHIQCPAVVVRRSLYERAGGFRSDLPYVADCEMWARALALGGGILSPLPLASYRMHPDNASATLLRTGDWLRDQGRLRDLFSALYPGFDRATFERRCSGRALALIRRYESLGQEDAAQANRLAWRETLPPSFRRRHLLQAVLIRLLRPPLRLLGLHLDRA